MSPATLQEELAATLKDPDVVLIELRTQATYADCISNPETPRPKRVELYDVAVSSGWISLWQRHGLEFPTPEPSEAAEAPTALQSPAPTPSAAPTPSRASRAVSAPPTPPQSASVPAQDAPEAPRPRARRKPPGVSLDAFGDPVVIELVCEACGVTFSRPKTRGRRPRYCGRPKPECGALPPSKTRKRRKI